MINSIGKSRISRRAIITSLAVLGATAVGVIYYSNRNPSRNNNVVYLFPNEPALFDVSSHEACLLDSSLSRIYSAAYSKRTIMPSLSPSGKYTLNRSDSCNVKESNLDVLVELVEKSRLDYKIITSAESKML
ncbi:hypothetical protein HY212_04515 [Candidatus Pacearchaeota archaeon]|nr:hypothetical protein [Candidatus Pacearchaeota archaeon]